MRDEHVGAGAVRDWLADIEVPDAVAAIVAVEPEPSTTLLVIDPDGLIHKGSCTVKAKLC